jgi:hypothetical protein
MIKKEGKIYGLLTPKMAESDTIPLGYGLCESGGTIHMTVSICTYNYRSSHWLG